MPEETVHEESEQRSRNGIASYFRRVADALTGSGPVPVDGDETVTVDPPAEPEMEVEVEREDGELSVEFEMAWDEEDGGVDTDAEESQATFELYQDNADEWRWRLRHTNGNIIADGGEGYSTKANAKNGIESVQKNAPGAVVEEQE
jgi:amphi-Trp domain-containing protein